MNFLAWGYLLGRLLNSQIAWLGKLRLNILSLVFHLAINNINQIWNGFRHFSLSDLLFDYQSMINILTMSILEKLWIVVDAVLRNRQLIFIKIWKQGQVFLIQTIGKVNFTCLEVMILQSVQFLNRLWAKILRDKLFDCRLFSLALSKIG